MPSCEEFRSLFHPDSVAVIGASTDSGKLGYHCLLSLTGGGFPGKIYPVHPTLTEISGLKAYPSVKDIPDNIDLAIIVLRASLVPGVLQECIEHGVKGVILISAGFREIEDSSGSELQDEIAAMASNAGVKIIGPNTFGMVNLHARLNASFTPEFSLTPRGNISLVSQSGGFCHLIAPLAMEEQAGMSKIIGLGNRCNIDFADMLEYLAVDPDTSVIMLYLEGIENGRQLFQVSREVTEKKPVVALKAGRFRVKDEAAKAHTGSLSGEYRVYTAAFEQAGIIVAESTIELLDIARALSQCPLPDGKRVAVLSGQAGPGIIAGDVCEQIGLVLTEFSTRTREMVESLLPPLAMRSNPVDMGPAWYDPETIRKVIEAILADENTDAIVLFAAYASANRPLLRKITPLLRSARKPVICCFPSPDGIWASEKKELIDSGIALFATPERAVKALAGLVKRREITSR